MLLALLILGANAVTLFAFTQIAHDQAEKQLRREMGRAKRSVETLFDTRRQVLAPHAAALADSPKFRSLAMAADPATFRDVAPEIAQSLGGNSLALYDPGGSLIGSTDPHYSADKTSLATRLSSDKPWSGLEIHQNTLVVASWQPIFTGGQRKGTLCLYWGVTDKFAESLAVSTDSTVAFSANGHVFGTSAPLSHNLAFRADLPQRFERDGEEIIGQFEPLLGPESGKTGLFVMRPASDLEGPFRLLSAVLWAVMVASLITALLIGNSFVRNITMPLAGVTAAAKEVRQGNWPSPFTEIENDEIGSLKVAFNQMIDAIHASQQRLLDMIDVDPLTEFSNHRAFKERIHEEIARAHREGDPLALVLIDIDKFAEFNATYGHAEGDRALIALAGLIREKAPEGSILGRYGGEEFGILIPGGTSEVAELTGFGILEGPGHTLSLSIGCSDLRVGIEETDALILAAELALSRAKQLGRGRVCRFDLALESNDPFELHKLQDGGFATIRALAAAVDAKDSYTQGHSERVAAYAKKLAAFAGASSALCDTVERSGLLHDVGKIGVPDAILKKADRLTPEERAIMETHPVLGEVIVRKVPQLEELLPGVRWHHERWDGRGYPDGLAGEAIPYVARVLAIADTFDAMTSDRPYRKGMAPEVALSEIERGAGTQFDPELSPMFVALMREEERRAA